jgi:hypothetical protein
LKQYNQLWEEQIQYSDYLKKPEHRIPRKATRDLELMREDGRPTLVAVRLKVLALLMLAGNLQLEPARPIVTQIVEEAMAQRNEFYTNPMYDKRSVAPMLAEAGLYQRQVLATAVLGTALGSQQQEEVCKKFKAELKRVDLMENLRQSARWPEYTQDLPKDSELVISRVGPISDSQFDGIIAEVAKIRVDGPPKAASDLH